MSDASSPQVVDADVVSATLAPPPVTRRSSTPQAVGASPSGPSLPPTAARGQASLSGVRSKIWGGAESDAGTGNGGAGRRTERSCQLCHRRKVRCDKKQPCASCARGGFQCYYPPVGQPVRRVRKTTIADVASRISDLEKTLATGTAQRPSATFRPPQITPASTSNFISSHPVARSPEPSTTLPSGPPVKVVGDEILVRKGTSSQYFDEFLISRVIEAEHDIQSVLTTPVSEPASKAAPSPFNPMGILSAPDLKLDLVELLPPKSGSIELWRNYVDNVDHCNKVLHRPTAEVLIYTAIDDAYSAPLDSMAVIFAVFFMSAVILEPSTVQRLTGEDKMTCLHRFKTGLEQAFAKADFLEHPSVNLLQALAVYMAGLRLHNPGRGLWTLNGLAIRAAQSIGLHRDGTRLGLGPFESEIRRRLWWHLLGRDGRGGEDYGIQNPSSFSMYAGVNHPLNLEDGDLYPEMKELPPPRRGWTLVTSALIHIQCSRAWHHLAALAASWDERPTPESVRAQTLRELHEYAEGFLQQCNPVMPQQRQTILVARLIIRKLDLVTRQQWLHLEHPEARESFATEENLVEALEIIELWMSIASDELLQSYRWSLAAFPQYHMLLYLLWHMCVKPEGPSVERAWRAINMSLGIIRSVGAGISQAAKTTILDALRVKALAIRQGLAQQSGGGSEGEQEGGGGSGSVEVDGSAVRDRSLTPGATEETVEAGKPDEVTDGIDWTTAMQDLPDWSTLMNEFQVDGLDFPNFFNFG
ncbi:fungal specific transcription factor domain-containing protein [Colletotrichum graminicola]|uniref:Fungal specific transcription factor domain-containing protein n=1 Tax=Colletotrichum graminicola (strain M1.001 / M2 / FGSC 10212) TaxID=645133 RepID=E3QU51_COLGM|nr:fungal specific transcription factor domain-containing protein [Colletotrichum graminicola M1.001]EFQ34389.1 fungal specific transcription factor domain-containing protein [Colletotrichum graminicola M1.001]WDK22554.1 fungal specific transcription factor domain-containing protein [Colletotrichum graminicola]